MRRMVTDKEIEKMGGTKLYKHTVTFPLDFSGDEETVTAYFVTTSGESLANKSTELSFLSGTLVYNYFYNPVISIDEYTIVYYYLDENSWTYAAIGSEQKFLTDKVEAL